MKYILLLITLIICSCSLLLPPSETNYDNVNRSVMIISNMVDPCISNTNLVSVIISFSGNTHYVPEYAFYGCTRLSNVSFNGGRFVDIQSYAFSQCVNLASVILDNGNDDIDPTAFIGDSNLTITAPAGGAVQAYCVSNGITFTGNGVIPYATIFSNGVQYQFDNNADFETCMAASDSVTYAVVENSIFGIPVTSIGVNAFASCTGLTNIVLPNSLTLIGANAFAYCSGLTNIVLPNSLTSIGDDAFQNCTGLTNLVINATNPPTLVGNSTFEYAYGLRAIRVPAGSVASYKAAAGWNQYSNIIVSQ